MINYRAVVSLYHGLSIRERVLVVITLLAATWGIWISSFGGILTDRVQLLLRLP